MHKVTTSVFAFLSLVLINPAYSQDCKALTDTSARLACFDKAAAAPKARVKPVDRSPIASAFNASKSRMFSDPYTMRDISLSAARPCLSGKGQCFCIEANAKTAAGGYGGLKLFIARFISDKEAEMIGDIAMFEKERMCGAMTPLR